MAIDVKKERRLNDMNALAESIKLGTELRRMDESIPTAEDKADWDGAVEVLGDFYKGDINTSSLPFPGQPNPLDKTTPGIYRVYTGSVDINFGWLIVASSYISAVPYGNWSIVQLHFTDSGGILKRTGRQGLGDEIVWSEWDGLAYQSDISKLKTNHTTITTPAEGQMAWNATTKKPVWYNGTAWIYADGTEV